MSSSSNRKKQKVFIFVSNYSRNPVGCHFPSIPEQFQIDPRNALQFISEFEFVFLLCTITHLFSFSASLYHPSRYLLKVFLYSSPLSYELFIIYRNMYKVQLLIVFCHPRLIRIQSQSSHWSTSCEEYGKALTTNINRV